MKFVLAFVLTLATILVLISKIDATSEPVCSYKNSQDETIFLKYLPLLKKGQDYVDFTADGKCVKRASCTDTFQTQVEECSKYPVTCANKSRYSGVFPACCIKC